MGKKNHTSSDMPGRRKVFTLMTAMLASAWARDAKAENAILQVAYIRSLARRPVISLLDQVPADVGLAGATLAMDDNNTTGRFVGQKFELLDIPVRKGADLVAILSKWGAQGVRLVMMDLPGDAVLALAETGRSQGMTIFNLAAPDDRLRAEDCRNSIIHVAASRDMLADAVGQYLVWKKWSRWLLVSGSHPDDKLLAQAYRRAAKRFGAHIVAERVSVDHGGSRQTDTGLVQTQQLMPLLTQGAPDYDVVVAADENEEFAGYLPYRTWNARPVAGSAGLEPVTWDASSVSWGGEQLQSRFRKLFHRSMMQLDMQAWTGIRMIGEAASRTRSVDANTLMAYMRGPEFGVAAYKGQRLTLRGWDMQLRQPILLSDGRSVISTSPQPGFLHQVTELDTLGVDQPETKCKFP